MGNIVFGMLGKGVWYRKWVGEDGREWMGGSVECWLLEGGIGCECDGMEWGGCWYGVFDGKYWGGSGNEWKV